jgi:putative DNA primase/helicase
MSDVHTSAPVIRLQKVEQTSWTPRALKATCTESDAGNAERFAIDHADAVRFIPVWNTWFIKDPTSGTFREDTTNAVRMLARATAGRIADETKEGMPGDEYVRRRLRHALQSQNYNRIRAMIDLAAADPRIVASPTDADANPDIAGMLNGVLDLRSGELITTGELVTKRLGCAYEPAADCPHFQQLLRTIFGDSSEHIDYMRRCFGYSLTGRIDEQIMLALIGPGANGKTTLLEALLALLGDYGARVPVESLLVSKLESQIPNELARLHGRRVAVATEIPQGRQVNEARVKEVTGGDTMIARYMRGEWFEFRPQFKLWLSGNHKPRIRGTDHGIWRRVRLLNLDVIIPDAEQDRRLLDKLRGELPGILNWALAGAREWYASGLATPAAVRAATDQYQDDEDLLAQFLLERCAPDPEENAALKELTASFNAWADTHNERRLSSRALGAWLEERGFRKVRGTGNAMVIQGLRIKL